MFRQKQRDVGLRLMLLDAVGIVLAWYLAVAVRHLDGISPEYIPVYQYTGLFWLAVILITFESLDLFTGRLRGLREASEVAKGMVLALLAFVALSFFSRHFSYSRLAVAYFAVLAPSLILLFRTLHHRVTLGNRPPIRVLVVGTGRTADSVVQEITRLKGLGYHLYEKIPDLERLEAICAAGEVDEVLVAVSDLSMEATRRALETASRYRMTVKLVPTFYELALSRMEWDSLNGIPVLTFPGSQTPAVTQSWSKRAVDILASGLGLLLLSPLFLTVAALIKITSKGPVFFVQKRTGFCGREFEFIKFRTMYVNSDENVHKSYAASWIRPAEATPEESRPGSHDHSDQGVFKLVQDPRITPIGAFLRKFSIDELPQLYNVLIGDMSLVGPRPPIPYEVEMYNEWEKRRLAVRPGITGLWQVSGRNRLSFREMVTLDLDYIQNWNLLLDFKILLRTIPVVLCWWEAF